MKNLTLSLLVGATLTIPSLAMAAEPMNTEATTADTTFQTQYESTDDTAQTQYESTDDTAQTQYESTDDASAEQVQPYN